VFSQVKANGMFATFIRSTSLEGDVNVRFVSRNGQLFPDSFSDYFATDAARMPDGHYHGELLAFSETSGDSLVLLPRQISNGHFNSVLKGGTMPAGVFPEFHTWDHISAETASRGVDDPANTYEKRYRSLPGMLDARRVRPIETKRVHSFEEAMHHYRDCLARGLEGTVIKHPDGIWRDHTSRHQIKLKLEVEVDLKVVAFNPARPGSKNVATFGSLQVATSCGKLSAGVQGFSETKRRDLWKRREEIVGSIISVKFNELTQTDKGYSLFLPVFAEERNDKDVADSLERVIEQYQSAIRA
jgi:DNA ligase-1